MSQSNQNLPRQVDPNERWFEIWQREFKVGLRAALQRLERPAPPIRPETESETTHFADETTLKLQHDREQRALHIEAAKRVKENLDTMSLAGAITNALEGYDLIPR